MLAPRNKLWSTPLEVIDEAIACLNVTPDDLVYDIGCGDGRFLVQCCKATGAKTIGIDINEDRVKEAQNLIEKHNLSSLCTVLSGNALEMNISDATVIFLYLIPRGLKLILPQILAIPRKVRMVTYMSPFQDKPHSNSGGRLESYLPYAASKKVEVRVGEHVVRYPIFVYETPGLPDPLQISSLSLSATSSSLSPTCTPPSAIEEVDVGKVQVCAQIHEQAKLECTYPGCGKELIPEQELIQCIKCKKCFYCSRDHQRLDLKSHKLTCNRTCPGVKPIPSPKPVPSSVRVVCELCGLAGIQTTSRTRKYTQMCNPIIFHENLHVMHFYCEGCCRKNTRSSMEEVTEKGENYPCWKFSPPCKCCRQIYGLNESKSDVEYNLYAPDPENWICEECVNECSRGKGGSKCMNMRVLKISDDCWVAGSGKYINPWWL